MRIVPPWVDLVKYRVVVVDCLDAELLTKAKATNAEMLRLENRTLQALGRRKSKISLQAHWTHLLVDEVKYFSRMMNSATKLISVSSGGTSLRAGTSYTSGGDHDRPG